MKERKETLRIVCYEGKHWPDVFINGQQVHGLRMVEFHADLESAAIFNMETVTAALKLENAQNLSNAFGGFVNTDNMKTWVFDGEPVTFGELEPGCLFNYHNTIALKSEYANVGVGMAIIHGTGEYFWDGAKTPVELNNLMVQPLKMVQTP